MSYPEFFPLVSPILVHDSLAEFLGAWAPGDIEYGYADAVKLAGHSCPTVAGAYLMTRTALQLLYPDSLPERGHILVRLRGAEDAGVTGVMASVAGLITGASGEGGFKGIGGRFERRRRLFFSAAIDGDMEFACNDNDSRVQVSYHPEVVPADPRVKPLLDDILRGDGSAAAREEFARLWQDRVKRILLEHGDDPRLITVQRH